MTQQVIMPQGHVTTYTTTGEKQVETSPVNLLGLLVRTDGLNDPTVGVYDGTAASNTVRIPLTEYEADVKSLNGVMLTFRLPCPNGLLVVITGDGARTVSVYYSRHPI